MLTLDEKNVLFSAIERLLRLKEEEVKYLKILADKAQADTEYGLKELKRSSRYYSK